MKKKIEIYIVKPSTRKKYKKFCKMIYSKYHKLFINDKHNNESINIRILMEILINNLKKHKNLAYARNVKYTTMDFINGIFDVLDNGTYWRRYKGTVPGKYLNAKHNEYCNMGVYDCMYYIILQIYFNDSKYEKLKHQSIDSTFIRNLYGIEMIQRNPHHKNKNGIKVSSINDTNGVPISYAIGKGATNDSKIAKIQINHSFVELNTNKVKNNNRYKQNMYADAQYDSQELIKILRQKGYKPRTDVNIRNTKNKYKLKQLELRKREYNKARNKRAIIEISYSWIHKYPKLNRFVEKSIKSYVGLLLLASSKIVIKKIN